jgi:hypothetical protein
MRTALAEKLLVKIMNWSSEEISEERPLIQALANLKYDEYQNFSSGSRFIESLVKWLDQFTEPDERKMAYSFIKEQLIFFSNDQLLHLVDITFSDKINPVLIENTASKLGISPYLISRIIGSKDYEETVRKSLFIGLSDGSRIDQLRRASGLNNEQVLPTYNVSAEKVEDMLAELKKSGYNGEFNSVFLIDDFTASGTSYFRFDSTKNEWKGKIFKTINYIINGNLKKLVSQSETIKIHIIFFIATEDSIKKLTDNINTWKQNSNSDFQFSIDAVQLITNEIRSQVISRSDFIELSKKYFDDRVINRHFKLGKYDQPYLGFNECGLPLVLSHNTPNNSLTILWLPEDMNYTGLFPRISRHKG